jgi:single-stranded DNA-binding protein
MLTNRNIIILEGGLTKDPEVFESAGVVHLSLAIDGAGSEKGVKNASGYFDIKFWLSSSPYSSEAVVESVKRMLSEKTLQKGSRVAVNGRLVQERWEKDGKKSSKVVVVADSIELRWSGNKSQPQQQNDNAASASSSSSSNPSSASSSASFEPIEF